MNHADPNAAALGPSEYVLTPAATVQVAARSRREFVCNRCERGQGARCRDRACTCCYGNED